MLTIYDVRLELQTNARVEDVMKLRHHFKTLSIELIGLDKDDCNVSTDELTFSVYGSIGPFMMKQMVQECTQKIFPGSIAAFLDGR